MTTSSEEFYTGLVSVDDLINYMSNPNLNAAQRLAAADVLVATQNELERYLNRTVELTQVREVVQVDIAGYLNVSVSPVHKIISISTAINSVETYKAPVMSEDQMTPDPLIGDNGRTQNRVYNQSALSGALIVPGGVRAMGMPGTYYVIEYVGGYDGRNDGDIIGAIKRVAARSVSSNHDDVINLRESNAEKAAVTDTRGKGWSQDELRMFDRLRRRVVA